MKLITVFFLSFWLSFSLYAENNTVIDNEQLLLKYLKQSVFEIDTTAQAIVLYEQGSCYMNDGKLSYKLERTIKILGKDAVDDLSKINIPFDGRSYVRKIVGTTYNLEEGKIVKQSVERSDMLKDKIDDDLTVTKFNLPSVKTGSIIHYTYIKEQPGFLFVPNWTFQGKYPTLYSAYDINIPSYIVFDALERINVPMFKAKKKKEMEQCEACSFDDSYSGNSVRYWVRRNIPAFHQEVYMSSSTNYLERIKIHVSALYRNGISINVYNNWHDFSKKFFFENKEGYGQVFNNNGFLEDKVKELTQNKTSEIDKTKAIFSYVRDNYDLTNESTRASSNIKEVFRRKTGSETGINLLLTAMLHKAGINSAPLLLSTRSNERLNKYYPDPDAINYLAGIATIDKKQYFMDASVKSLPFGMLLPECYNGYCRIVTEEGGETILDADSVTNKAVIFVSLAPYEKDKQKLLLKVQYQYGAVSSIAYRKDWQNDSLALQKQIIQKLAGSTLTTTLKNFTIKNLRQPDEKLTLEYEALIELNPNAATLYFDPYFVKFLDKNPFVSTTRKYPIERNYQEDINYVFHFQLPEGYVIDDYPKSTIYKFSDQELLTMKNIMNYEEAKNSFSLNSRFTTRTTLFDATEYNDIRTFYERVMEEQDKKIVLKKLN